MSSSKSTSSYLIAAAATAVAVATAVYIQRSFQRRRKGDEGKGKNLKFQDGSQESLVNERFQACVQAMAQIRIRIKSRSTLSCGIVR